MLVLQLKPEDKIDFRDALTRTRIGTITTFKNDRNELRVGLDFPTSVELVHHRKPIGVSNGNNKTNRVG